MKSAMDVLIEMESIELDNPDIIALTLESTSKGNQRKFYNKRTHEYIKEAFYYQGRYWKDSYVEHLAWELASMTDTLGVSIVKQDVVYLRGKAEYENTRLGCVSRDFLFYADRECEWMSCQRVLKNIPGRDLGKSFKVYTTLKDQFREECNVDITNYLVVMIVFDYLLGNEDRHYNNFGILRYMDMTFGIAPLFDFGLGLFEHDVKYSGKTLNEAVRLIEAKPFSTDLRKPVQMLCNLNAEKKLVARICEGIRVPDRVLFPSELAYEYFSEALDELRRLCND